MTRHRGLDVAFLPGRRDPVLIGSIHSGKVMMRVAGRNVLVTGGASGLGRLLAHRLADRGARVVLWDLDETAAKGVAAELGEATGREHHAYRCDVGDRRAVYRLADLVKAEVGPVDVVVNNAGIVSGRYLLDLPDDRIEATFRVNTLALYWVTKAFLAEMIDRGEGHVVTMGSAGGLLGVAGQTDYGASKAAAINFDEALRMELRELGPGVRTTVVCPYYIDTGMFAGVRTRFAFLLPILAADDVARKVVDAVERDRRRVILPWFAKTVPVMRVLPVAAFDWLADFFGINAGMRDFVGRAKGPDSPAAP